MKQIFSVSLKKKVCCPTGDLRLVSVGLRCSGSSGLQTGLWGSQLCVKQARPSFPLLVSRCLGFLHPLYCSSNSICCGRAVKRGPFTTGM